MATISASVGRNGVNKPADARTVQSLLNRHVGSLGLRPLVVDGIVGPKTIEAIVAFQRRLGMSNPDGRVDPNGRTLAGLNGTGAAAAPASPPPPPMTPSSGSGSNPGAGHERDPNWPPKPAFPPLTSNAERAAIFGSFEYVHDPKPNNPENIRVLGDWATRNIVTISIDMGPNVGQKRVAFHRLAVHQLQGMWEEWKKEGLLHLVLSYAGSYVPRFVRGSTRTLSNHAFGSAFDINVPQNGLGKVPALVGQPGSVRELVPIANKWGFYWGGHFSRLDGMHFEVAKIL